MQVFFYFFCNNYLPIIHSPSTFMNESYHLNHKLRKGVLWSFDRLSLNWKKK